MGAAPKTVKDNGGQANNNNTYVENTAPGNSDTVKIDGNSKKVTLTEPITEWGAVDFSAGSIEGNKKLSLTLTSSLWTGGVIDGAKLSTPGITIGSGSEKKLQGAGQLEVTNGGTANWTGDDLVTGGGAEIKNSGTFTTNFGGKITKLSGETSKFTNSGSFVKETAGTTTEIQATFDSKDTGSNVTVNGGTLKLTGGGESSKAVTLANGTKLEVSSTDYVFSGGTLNATGTGSIDVTGAIATFGGTSGSANLAVNGGTARVNGSHATSGRLKLSSGKLDATATSGTATVGGFDWTGGDVSGVIVNSADTTISSGGTKKLIGSAKLNLSGATNWSADSIGTGDSAEITNTGSFTTNFDGTLAHNQGGTRATFKNAGSFTKSNTTSGTTEIQASFQNTDAGASVAVNGGTLKLSGGGSSNKGISLATGTTLQIADNDFAVSGGAVSGSGKLELASSKTTFSNSTSNGGELAITGGTAQFDGTHTGSGKLSLLAGGSVTGSGTASFGSLDWKGGQVNGKVSTAGAASLSGADAKTIGTSGELSLSANESRAWSGGAIANQGKLTLSSGTTDIQASFSNSGALETNNGGVVKVRGGGSSSNAVTVGAGSKLEISTANFAFNGGTLNSDTTGDIEVTGATASFSGTTGSANLTVSGSGTVNFSGTHATTGKLKLDAGTIQGTSQAEVGAFDFNTGSLNGKVRATGATQLSGDNKAINGGELVVAGTADFGGGTVTLSNSAKIKTEAGKTFRVNADGTFANGNSASIVNDGSFEKLGGTGTTAVNAVFDSAGAVSIAADKGALKLAGGGKTTGSVAIGANAKLEVAGQNYTFENATHSGDGLIDLTGATTTFKNTTGTAKLRIGSGNATFDTSLSTASELTLDGGTLASNAGGSAQVGALTFNTGSLNGKVRATGATQFSSANKAINGGELVIAGTADFAGGTVTLSNNAKVKTEAGKAFRVNADGTFANGNSASIVNDGSFEKLGGTGTTAINAAFDSAGAVAIAADKGALKLAGGGKTTGSVAIGANAKLEVAGQNYTFENATHSGDGLIDLTGATTTFRNTTGTAKLRIGSGNATFDTSLSTASELTLDGGTLASNAGGSAQVGALTFNTGSLNGKVRATGATQLSGDNKAINGGELVIAGTADFGGGTVTLSNNAKVKTEAGKTFRVNADGTFANGNSASIVNDGSFEKLGGTGTTAINAAFDSAGAVAIAADKGALKLAGGGKTTGSVAIGANAKLEVAGQNYTFENATHSGDGLIDLTGATTTFRNTTGSAKLRIGGGNATFDTSLSTASELTVDGGTLASSNGGSAEVGALTFNTGSLNGKVRATGATQLSGDNKAINGGELVIAGTADFAGGTVTLSNSAKIKTEAGKTFRVNADGTFANGNSASIVNEGSFEKLGGTGTTSVNAVFNSTGAVTVGSGKGTLRLTGGGKSSGAIGVGTGSTLQIAGVSYEFENVSHSGGGVIEVASSTATFRAANGSGKFAVSGGAAVFDASESTASELALLAGTVTSSNGGSAVVGGLLWSGGSLNAKVKSNGNAILGGSGKTISGGDLTLAGTTTWDGTTIATGNGSKLANDATGVFNAGDGAITHTGGTRATFTNSGHFNKNSGSGSTVLDTLFENSGTVTVSSGKLKLTQGANNADNSKLEVAAGAELELNGNVTLTSKTELKGNGKARFLGLTLLANALIDIANFDFDGGTLTGSNKFGGVLNWNDGNWNSAGNTTIGHGAVLNLNKTSSHEFNGRGLTNEGTINWLAGNIRAGNGSVFTNEAVFNDLNGGAKTILAPGGFGGTFTFTNNGLYKKTTGGTTTIEIAFVNNGTMEIAAGSVVFAGTFTNHGSVLMKNGANANFTTPISFTASQPLSGTGVIDAPQVTAAGLVSPGTSPGMLTVTGNLTLLSTSELLIELAGPTQGSGYDFMSVGGSADLGGSQLKLSLLGGYGASILPTDTFTVLSASTSLSGTFANVANGQRLFMVDGVGSFQVNYGLGSAFSTTSVVLSNFSPVPEPSTWALIIAGVLVVAFQLRRRKE